MQQTGLRTHTHNDPVDRFGLGRVYDRPCRNTRIRVASARGQALPGWQGSLLRDQISLVGSQRSSLKSDGVLTLPTFAAPGATLSPGVTPSPGATPAPDGGDDSAGMMFVGGLDRLPQCNSCYFPRVALWPRTTQHFVSSRVEAVDRSCTLPVVQPWDV